MREVDEEVRKAQAVEFWQRWGKWIAGLVILGLAAFGGWLYWSNAQTATAEQEGEALARLLEDLNAGTPDDIDGRLEPLASSDRTLIRAEAQLTQAALALQNQDLAGAIALYAGIVADTNLPQQFRDLALIRQTAVEFEDMEPQAVIDRLAGLAVPGNPWFGSAGELIAAAMLAAGNKERAGALFAQIANDDTVPETLRTRSVQMAGVLDVDAVPDEPVEIEEQPIPSQPLAADTAEETTS